MREPPLPGPKRNKFVFNTYPGPELQHNQWGERTALQETGPLNYLGGGELLLVRFNFCLFFFSRCNPGLSVIGTREETGLLLPHLVLNCRGTDCRCPIQGEMQRYAANETSFRPYLPFSLVRILTKIK